MLKFLSWNILQGGGSRAAGVVKFIASEKPHIVVLSEFRNNDKGNYIRKQLLDLGFNFQAVSLTHSDTNSVLIASRVAFNSRLFLHTKLDFAHAVIAADFDAFHLYGVYLPHKKKHKLFELLIDEVAINKPALIMGDFNTGKNFIDQKGDSFWYVTELTKLEKTGTADAFRYINGDVTAYSWFSHQGNGYRYDHIYVSKELLPVINTCDYIHEAREEKLSDHSPMFLTLK